jgi:hypothetical protein
VCAGNNLTWDASSWTYSQLQYVDMSYNLAVTGLGSLGQLPTNLRVGRFRRAGITYSTLSGGSTDRCRLAYAVSSSSCKSPA